MRTRVESGSPYEQHYGFSRAIRVGDRVFVAGTAPIPPDGADPPPDAFAQLKLCGEIALTALAELGATAADVVRTRMFITDPADADDIGRAHLEVFGESRPAATMVVTRLLDERWKIELEVDAVVAER